MSVIRDSRPSVSPCPQPRWNARKHVWCAVGTNCDFATLRQLWRMCKVPHILWQWRRSGIVTGVAFRLSNFRTTRQGCAA